MLSKHLITRGLLLKNSTASRVFTAAYHAGDGPRKPTMNDLPIPEGDWQEEHNRQNTKYNMILASGLAALVGTIVLSKSLGIPEWNSEIPKLDD